MSAQPKLYEGPSLEPLLEQITREVGPDAKIVRAEKSRHGGVMGFFARERYHLTVEEPSTSTSRAPRPTGPRSEPSASSRGPTTDRATRTLEAPTSTNSTAKRRSSATRRAEANGRPKANGRPEKDGRPEVTAKPQVTGDLQVTSKLTSTPEPVHEPEVSRRSEASNRSLATSRHEPTQEPEATGTFGIRVPTRATPPEKLLERAVPDAFAALAEATEDELRVVITRPKPTASTTPHACFDDVLQQVAIEAAGSSTQPSATGAFANIEAACPSSRPNPAGTLTNIEAAGPSSRPNPAGGLAHEADVHPLPAQAPTVELSPRVLHLAEQLRRSGLRHRDVLQVISALGDGRRYVELLVEVFRQAPASPALPRYPGAVIAVVGAGRLATKAAAALAAELGLPAPALAALPGRLRRAPGRPQPQEASRSRQEDGSGVASANDLLLGSSPIGSSSSKSSWSGSSSSGSSSGSPATAPVVVSIDSAMTGASRMRAAHYLATITPAAVWGVVEATAKPEDVDAWASALGGLDALMVTKVAATVSPAAILRCGIPVARLDGSVATPERWAATVGDLVAP